MGVRVRREGNAGFKLGRHLVFAAVLLHEVLAHRVGLHSELALLPTHSGHSVARPAGCVRGGRGSAAAHHGELRCRGLTADPQANAWELTADPLSALFAIYLSIWPAEAPGWFIIATCKVHALCTHGINWGWKNGTTC